MKENETQATNNFIEVTVTSVRHVLDRTAFERSKLGDNCCLRDVRRLDRNFLIGFDKVNNGKLPNRRKVIGCQLSLVTLFSIMSKWLAEGFRPIKASILN